MNLIFLITLLLAASVHRVNSDEELCNVPHPGHSTVPDCNCKFNSVDYAVKHFISPILSNLTTQAFFRYFKVDLDSACPFWQEAGQCSMEGCSVCPCDEDEIPKPWLERDGKQGKNKEEYGWVSFTGSDNMGDESLGKISVAEGEERDLRLDGMYNDPINGMNNVIEIDIGTSSGIQSEPDEDFDDTDEWTSLHNYSNRKYKKQDIPNLPSFASAYGYGALFESIDTAEEVVNDAAYVNLLENPERFTGYSGPSAQRVWKAIQEENCFGELSDVCLEKRIFYRLMSGLQASITTHIARSYRHADGSWGSNPALYWRAVGDHPDRLNNMYFSFLFLLRAVVRAQEVIRTYPYNTGHTVEDQIVRELLDKLLASSHLAGSNRAEEHHSSSRRYTTSTSSSSFLTVEDDVNLEHSDITTSVGTGSSGSEHNLKALLRGGDIPEAAMAAVEECRYGFNESEMFQVSPTLKGPQYWNTLEEKQELRNEFMTKFRNISRIMDCVTCDKCRVWGKLQILGIGTAIKILLHPSEDIILPKASVLNNSNNNDNYMDNNSNNIHQNENKKSSTKKAGSCDVIDIKHTNRLNLNRQEIIALLNTLNNFAHSLKYASDAAIEAKRSDIIDDQVMFAAINSHMNGNIGLNNVLLPINPSKLPGRIDDILQGFSWSTIMFIGIGYLSPLLLFMAYCLRIRYTATTVTTDTTDAGTASKSE